MTIKRKNDDIIAPFEQSPMAEFQRILRVVKTQQLDLRAGPEECIDWIEAFQIPPSETNLRVQIETQCVKRPAQFSLQFTTPAVRSINMGRMVGEVVASADVENQSVIYLRFYPGASRIVVIPLWLITVGPVAVMLISEFQSSGVSGVFLAGGFVFLAIVAFLGYITWKALYKALWYTQDHLLKLNSDPRPAIDPTV